MSGYHRYNLSMGPSLLRLISYTHFSARTNIHFQFRVSILVVVLRRYMGIAILVDCIWDPGLGSGLVG